MCEYVIGPSPDSFVQKTRGVSVGEGRTVAGNFTVVRRGVQPLDRVYGWTRRVEPPNRTYSLLLTVIESTTATVPGIEDPLRLSDVFMSSSDVYRTHSAPGVGGVTRSHSTHCTVRCKEPGDKGTHISFSSFPTSSDTRNYKV